MCYFTLNWSENVSLHSAGWPYTKATPQMCMECMNGNLIRKSCMVMISRTSFVCSYVKGGKNGRNEWGELKTKTHFYRSITKKKKKNSVIGMIPRKEIPSTKKSLLTLDWSEVPDPSACLKTFDFRTRFTISYNGQFSWMCVVTMS